jgi:hypothetical protein
MTLQDFENLTNRIASLGYNDSLAGEIAAAIGDTPPPPEDGEIPVIVGGVRYYIPIEVFTDDV